MNSVISNDTTNAMIPEHIHVINLYSLSIKQNHKRRKNEPKCFWFPSLTGIVALKSNEQTSYKKLAEENINGYDGLTFTQN